MAERHAVIQGKPVFPTGQITPPEAPGPCFNPVFDCGDGEGDVDWSYICERGEYQAWFGFDLSSIPDDTNITSITFTALILKEDDDDPGTPQRTLWYDPDDTWMQDHRCPGNKPLTELVASLVQWNTEFEWLTFNLDLSKHDWKNDLADDYVTLMLTGPLNGSHVCGIVALSESGNPPCLTIRYGAGIPAMNVWGAIILSLLLAGSAIWALRRKRRIS
jgi:hypothetical protein